MFLLHLGKWLSLFHDFDLIGVSLAKKKKKHVYVLSRPWIYILYVYCAIG